MSTEGEKFAAVDYETYYDKEYSLRTMSTWSYVFDEDKFDAYLVAITDGKGIKYVGHPSKFDWSLLKGYTLVAHNVGFDGLVTKRLIQDGIIPVFIGDCEWVDTADLISYLHCKRSLKDGVQQFLGIDMSKAVRDQMKGKTHAQAIAAGMEEELLKYGGMDADYCLQLWHKLQHLWPEAERRISKENRESGWRGININEAALNHALRGMGKAEFNGWSTDEKFVGIDIQTFNALQAIPWVKDGEKPLSPHAIRAAGHKAGIGAPSSFGQDNPEFMVWEDVNAEKFPWVRAIRDFRRLNTVNKKLHNIENGVHDGVFSYQCKYWGASTGRFSGGGDGGGKFNVQNMYRGPIFGVDVRKLFVPPAGHKFIVSDYAQVEARVLLWRAGDKSFLELLAKEGNLYQAYAKKRGLYKGNNLKKDDPNLYQHSKVGVLSCGYQCGWSRYRSVAETTYGLVMSKEQAQEAVYAYRAIFPLVPERWEHHKIGLEWSVNRKDPTHEVALASGRDLVYYNPRIKLETSDGKKQIVASDTPGGNATRLYGGLITENEIQATCRDLLRDAWLAAVDAGYTVCLSVHDELVFVVPDAKANAETLADIKRIMTTCSPWLAGCPLDVESHVLEYYTK